MSRRKKRWKGILSLLLIIVLLLPYHMAAMAAESGSGSGSATGGSVSGSATGGREESYSETAVENTADPGNVLDLTPWQRNKMAAAAEAAEAAAQTAGGSSGEPEAEGIAGKKGAETGAQTAGGSSGEPETEGIAGKNEAENGAQTAGRSSGKPVGVNGKSGAETGAQTAGKSSGNSEGTGKANGAEAAAKVSGVSSVESGEPTGKSGSETAAQTAGGSSGEPETEGTTGKNGTETAVQTAGGSSGEPEAEGTTGKNGTETAAKTTRTSEELCNVSFRGHISGIQGETELWQAKVAYGSELWNLDAAPWEGEGLVWTEIEGDSQMPEGISKTESSEVTLHLGEADNPTKEFRVTVFRHTQDKTLPGHEHYADYYYTFTIEGTPYFTYGGSKPETEGHHFAAWSKKDSQGTDLSGSAVLEDGTVFTARYTAAKSYIFHVYYYYSNGVKARDPQTIVTSETEVKDGMLTVPIRVPSVKYYAPSVDTAELAGRGITCEASDTEETWTVTADVSKAFDQSAAHVNQNASIIVLYSPSAMNYKIVYHLQKTGKGTDKQADYVEAGYLEGTDLIGETISVPDRPTELQDASGAMKPVDFGGFEADSVSQQMIYHGKRLEESLVTDDTAVIHMYYNRSYYYVYTLIDTTENDPYDPIRVQYGMSLAGGDESIRPQKTGYVFQEWKWYYSGANGQLELLNGDGARPQVMPHYNIYAVAVWKKAYTSMQIVYWIEDANSGSYQNTYQKEIKPVPTGDRLVLHLTEGKYNMSLEEDPSTTFPVFTESFQEAIKSKYGEENADYTKYFTFDPKKTYQEEVGSKHASGNSGGNQLLYEVKADGTTTINLYYKRNLYTLEFIISRTVNGVWWVPKDTNGGDIPGLFWTTEVTGPTRFDDFASDKVENRTGLNTTFGTAAITAEYRLKDAVERGDTRAVTGRYGTRPNGNHIYRVYYLTARFEAEIADLWPTLDNIHQQNESAGRYQYISMGTNKDSLYYYLRTLPGAVTKNKNILNQYSTMDVQIVDHSDGTTVPDNEGKAQITHQMYAYWAKNNIHTYKYYFLYEVLDTTLRPDAYPLFNPKDAYEGKYQDGDIVKWTYQGDTSLYIYRPTYISQNSTNNLAGQNQPAKNGFVSMDRTWYSSGTDLRVYYFYKRELKTLSIYNVNRNWVPGADFLNKELELSYTDEQTGSLVTGKTCLAKLGWEEIQGTMQEGTNPEETDQKGENAAEPSSARLIRLRYGADLGAISQDAVCKAFQEETYPLKYPYKSLGVNQYYFHGWFKDQEHIVPVDWSARAMQTMIQDQVLYTGWTTPKYRTTYVLNGGTWTDAINMTIMFAEIDKTTIILYYPHMASDPKTEMYWYIPKNHSDYLYMDEFYITTLETLMEANKNGDGHYHLKNDLTLEQMIRCSTKKDPGTNSGGTSYVCYMQGEGFDGRKDESHRNYIHRHALAGSELPEPSAPVRNGYDFLGWYAFDTASEGTGDTGKVWLDEALEPGDGLHSYKEESVYINSAGEAYLVRADENEGGRLYYHSDQKGYRYSYEFGASIVSEDRMLYAAWKGQEVNESKVLHLVEMSQIAPEKVRPDWAVIRINGKDYYEVLPEESRSGVESGTTQIHQARGFAVDGDARIWLPQKAQIDLDIGSGTPDGVSGRRNVYDHTGDEPVFRIQIPNLDTEAYTYYAYFVYSPVDQPAYTIYQIDLREAVLQGALKSYSDTFDREHPPRGDASYVIHVQRQEADMEHAVVTVNAPQVSDYTVYEKWKETLHLQSDPGGNNIYFYYINTENDISISITYHFMKNGNYEDAENVVKVTGLPAQTGQNLDLDKIKNGYVNIITLAERVRGYANSGNQAQADLYARYKGMRIEGKADDICGDYYVDAKKPTTLPVEPEKKLIQDYVLDYISPEAENGSVTITKAMHIDVYMQDARVKIRKKDTSGRSLQGAEFTLERLRKLGLDETLPEDTQVIAYENAQYAKDSSFVMRDGVTDQSGEIVFYDLSTNIEAGYLYRLKETKAPPGYGALTEPVYIRVPYQITADGETKTYYSVTYDIVNPGMIDLPKAGRGGFVVLLFAGGGMLTLGLLGCEACCGKNRDRRRKDK